MIKVVPYYSFSRSVKGRAFDHLERFFSPYLQTEPEMSFVVSSATSEQPLLYCCDEVRQSRPRRTVPASRDVTRSLWQMPKCRRPIPPPAPRQSPFRH